MTRLARAISDRRLVARLSSIAGRAPNPSHPAEPQARPASSQTHPANPSQARPASSQDPSGGISSPSGD